MRAVHAEQLIVVARGDERGGDVRLAVDDDVDAAERRAREQIRHRLVVGHELLEHRVRERRRARSRRQGRRVTEP